MDFLVLGTLNDPHVERVTQNLLKRGLHCEVLDIDAKVNLHQSPDGACCLLVNGERVDESCLIWDRLKLFLGSPFYPGPNLSDMPHEEFEFCMDEWRAFCALLTGLHAHQTVNNPLVVSGMHKILQQLVANEVGLATPATLVTNAKADVMTFAHLHRRVVLKGFQSFIRTTVDSHPALRGLLTVSVTRSALDEADERQLRCCPHMFQVEIAKAYELRIAVAGDMVLPFRIDSQAHEDAKTDWRRGGVALKYEPADIPSGIADKIRLFMKRFDLCFGQVDLIVDPEGCHWFLECNQDGQWTWLDNIANGQIARAFADALTERLALLRTERLTRTPSLPEGVGGWDPG